MGYDWVYQLSHTFSSFVSFLFPCPASFSFSYTDPITHPHLTTVISLIPTQSLWYTTLLSAFQIPLTHILGHSGWLAAWALNYLSFLALGLAMEVAITVLGIRGMPFFLILWIILNITSSFLPIGEYTRSIVILGLEVLILLTYVFPCSPVSTDLRLLRMDQVHFWSTDTRSTIAWKTSTNG